MLVFAVHYRSEKAKSAPWCLRGGKVSSLHPKNLCAKVQLGCRLMIPDNNRFTVDAGFTPSEALEAATRVPAEFLKQLDSGTIEEGKSADLVILDKNPLENIRNSTSIDSVVLRGRLFNRRELDRLLAEAEKLAAWN